LNKAPINKRLFKKAAAFLALFIGMMSIFAGSKVLLKIDAKDYNVLIWLVSYNVLFGIVSIIAAYTIWKNKAKSKSFTLFILFMHFMVFIYLKFMSDSAASESIIAMFFRVGIWTLIAVLSLIIPNYLSKQQK